MDRGHRNGWPRRPLRGGFESVAASVSADGSVVVGLGLAASRFEAFRWTEATGMVGLGDLAGGGGSEATGVAADGLVIVGIANRECCISLAFEAFRWTEATGMVGLGDLPGLSFDSRAFAVSADGSVIVAGGTPYQSPSRSAGAGTPFKGIARSAHGWGVGSGLILPPSNGRKLTPLRG